MPSGSFNDGLDSVLDNHNVYRDGSVWACRYCRRTWDFPSPIPRGDGPCVPRRWGDREPESTAGHAHPAGEGERPVWDIRLPRVYRRSDGGPTPLGRECPKCHAAPGELCIDGRKAYGTTVRPHRERG
jgi:hypothetical protein